MPKPIRIMLVDDHALIIKGTMEMLGEQDEYSFDVVCTALTPEEACDKYIEFKPDVLVIDVLFQGSMTGIDAIEKIKEIDPDAKIVVLSQHDQSVLVKSALEKGALAYVLKMGDDEEELIEAIVAASNNQKYMPQKIIEKLAFYSLGGDQNPKEALSDREFQVYKLIAEDDATNTEIADRLDLSTKAVSSIIERIRKKLGLKRNTEITKHAIKHRIISLDD